MLQSHLRRFVRGAEAEVVEEEEVEEEKRGGASEDEGAEVQQDAEDGELDAQDVAMDGRDEEDEGDELVVVEDSFRAPSPSLRAPVGPTQGAELVAASCVCVHGSQDEDAEDETGDVEIVDESPAPAPRRESRRVAQDTSLPFGAARAEVAGTVVAADTDLAFDFAALSSAWTSSPSSSSDLAPPTAGPSSPSRARSADADELAGAAIGEHDDAAEATLSRIVSKDDFAQMEVVGQFNLGFIIARRRVSVGSGKGKERAAASDTHDDLFIVDQHASDEKYNFEKLQAETVIQSQRLIAPRILNFASADELMAMEHVDLLRLNGFDVLVDEDADVGERVKLIAQPVSKDTVFDTGDLEELVDLIGSRSGNEVVRPSKARRMFASRACRKSVMVGKALNVKQMTQILRNMAAMDQPWACPHGRPTMRWLASMSAPLALDSRFDVGELCSSFE
ncbi:uncharacterized protein RHOBADRAFT_27977 [Rhodotorula graminis WP1]|uniref:MutL C-terminal dimerisation domain-containing protein n=1 Tax=Rhodotorula graminis (strain WP1) TaxID=578459 RepID=A0A194S1N9_RHOGW|nr:uncharacterized protein RHOBADRAFT_27977 [Rhodotorula graminis WP1]KPV74450.1 hypothetical protein RHOBADRAFT_27977 [Rhodotorula graminis WP1]